MTIKAAELCAGYGGLAAAIEEVFNAQTVWVSEFEEAPSKILAHHWPNAHNYGDMTKVDWSLVDLVDVLGGGTPCQDLSHAGKRGGMTEGTRSNLWVNMREAIAVIRPKWVVWENVRGAYSAEASSDLEFCPGCVGDTSDGRVFLRALGRVLGDLSDLGYDTEWRGLRASDVGAPHARFRVFVLARRRGTIIDASSVGGNQAEQHHGRGPSPDDRPGVPDESDRDALRLGPIREVTADADRFGVDRAGERPEQDRRGQLADGGVSPADAESLGRREGRTEPARILRGLAPARDSAPSADANSRDDDGRFGDQERSPIGRTAAAGGSETNWGEYEAAIRRWEIVLGRPAPRPTEPTGRDNGERLSPRFTEWMMGLPDGWVTDPSIGISRNEQLKACGNGVVPQQAVAALRDMLAAFQTAEVAA